MNATLEEAKEYYLGKSYQFGYYTDERPYDVLVEAVSVDEL
jgi:hypothetical protein